MALDEEQRLMAMHHPFTAPKPCDVSKLDTDPASVLADAYDMVCNGVEVGGGSIRIHDAVLQAKIFEVLGFTPERAQEQFGFLMNAFKFGAPPHGGMAPGIDRIIMLLNDVDNLREVQAFPTSASGIDNLMGSPSELTEQQLRELHIKIR